MRSTICRTGWIRSGYVTRKTWLRSCYRGFHDGQLCQVRDYTGPFSSRPTPLPAQRQFRFQQDVKHSKPVRQHQLRCHSPVSRPRSDSLESVLWGEPTKWRQAAAFFRYQSSHETQLLSIPGHKPQTLQFTRRLVFFRATEDDGRLLCSGRRNVELVEDGQDVRYEVSSRVV